MDEGKELLEGFNAGYLIEKHRPALSQKLVSAVNGTDIPFIKGFVAGTEEYSKERTKNITIAKLREFAKGAPKPPMKGKDDREIDKEK